MTSRETLSVPPVLPGTALLDSFDAGRNGRKRRPAELPKKKHLCHCELKTVNLFGPATYVLKFPPKFLPATKMATQTALQTLVLLCEIWWRHDSHRLLPALAATSRQFGRWAREAAGRVRRLTRAVTCDATSVTLLVRTCAAAEEFQPRGTPTPVDLLHLMDLGWLPRSMVSAMQRSRCVWKSYYQLQVFPTRTGRVEAL